MHSLVIQGRGSSRWTVAQVTLWCAFAARLVFVAVFLPPWQNPDEPDHFAVIRTLSSQSTVDLTSRHNVGVEREILTSMTANGWWTLYDLPIPNPPPRSFDDVPQHLGASWNAPPTYYIIASRYLRLIGARGLLAQYYSLRAAAVVISLATFWLVIAGAREWFDETTALCAGALVALVPQFALIAVSISPDPVIFAASTFVWWQGGRLSAERGGVAAIVMMLAATMLAVFAKRIAVPLIGQTMILVAVPALTGSRHRLGILAAAAGLVAAAVAMTLAAGKLMARPSQLATEVVTGPGVVIAMAKRSVGEFGWSQSPSLAYFGTFTWRLFESAYLVAGWMRFHAPAILIALAFGIFLFAIVRCGRVYIGTADRRFRLAVAMTASFAAVQLAAIYGTNYYVIGAQGRFLFPAIGPFAALAAIGLTHWGSGRVRIAACSAAVGLLALVDIAAWVTTVIPAYSY